VLFRSLGDRVIKNLAAYQYKITNKDWESTIGVARNHFIFDSLGLLNPRFQNLGNKARLHMDKLVFRLLPQGFATVPSGLVTPGSTVGALCYDGQYFFDNDHSEGDSGTQSNVGSTVYSFTNVVAAIGAMLSIKSDAGTPIGVMPDTLVVCPLDYLQAVADCASLNMAAAGTAQLAIGNMTQLNPLAKLGLNVITSPDVDDGTNRHSWWLLSTKTPLKPLVGSVVKEGEFVAVTDPAQDSVFMSKEFKFGVDGIYNVGYGLWQMAYGSQHT
jgi:phage major head subunit gpT-like protein